MNSAFRFNFAIVKLTLLQLSLIYALLGMVINVFCGNIAAGMGIVAVVGPFLCAVALFNNDVRNDWERFCAVLPFGRKNFVLGRYACILVCAGISGVLAFAIGALSAVLASMLPFVASFDLPDSLFEVACFDLGLILVLLTIASISLPVMFKYGMTRAVAFIPIVLVLIFAGLAMAIPTVAGDYVGLVDSFVAGNIAVVLAAMAIVCALLVVLSAAISVKVYLGREL